MRFEAKFFNRKANWAVNKKKKFAIKVTKMHYHPDEHVFFQRHEAWEL